MKELLHTLAMFRHIDKDEMESVEYKEELRLKAEAAAKEAGLSLEGEKKREKRFVPPSEVVIHVRTTTGSILLMRKNFSLLGRLPERLSISVERQFTSISIRRYMIMLKGSLLVRTSKVIFHMKRTSLCMNFCGTSVSTKS